MNGHVWVFCDTRRQGLLEPGLKVLGKARELARSLSAGASAVICGGAFDDFLSENKGADQYNGCDHPGHKDSRYANG